MAAGIITNNLKGLPLDANGKPQSLSGHFTPPSEEPVTIVFSGSLWTNAQGVTIGFELLIDGKVVGQSQVFANQGSVHVPTIPAVVNVQLPYKINPTTQAPEAVEFVIQVMNDDTLIDFNDYFTAYII